MNKKILNYLPVALILILASVLRLVALDKYPAGLNADEAAIGYNAYSLLETGRDEHSAAWPLVFRSFDDYKPPLYFYLVLPFVKFLGLNVWAVRLPSAILGIASVYLLYLLVKRLFPQRPGLASLSALLLAISPWHLHFSRGGWEANASSFFLLLAINLFFKGLKTPQSLIGCLLALVASLYTYHSMRIIIPFLAVALLFIYWSEIKALFQKPDSRKYLIIAIAISLVLVFPLLNQMFGEKGQSRFSGVSVFADQGPLWQALERRRLSPNPNSLLTKVLHNRYLSYTRRFIQNYLSHYSPRFLYITGDEIARSKVPGMGQDYLFLAPFLLLGLWPLLKLDNKPKKFFLAWFLIAPLAAALTFQSPHALRAQNLSIPLVFVSALGVYQLFQFVKNKKLISYLLTLIFSFTLVWSLGDYLHRYYIHYPKELPFAWEYGFQQLGDYLKEHQSEYDSIIISDRYDQPYILTAFFLDYPPAKFQQEIELTSRDDFGFSTVNSFGKYTFKTIDIAEDLSNPQTLVITTEEGTGDHQPIYQIDFPNGEAGFKFFDH